MKRLISLSILIPTFLFAIEGESIPLQGDGGAIVHTEGEDNEVIVGPWLTGPLLTPSAHTIPGGHFNIEPYLFVNDNIGYFNNHWHLQRYSEPPSNINMQCVTQIGLNSWMDFQFIPQFFYNYIGRDDAWRFGDLLMGLGFQIVNQNDKKGIPAVKLQINEVFPVGEYQNLFPDKSGTDSAGGGTYGTQFNLIFSRQWHFGGPHFLAARAQVGCGLFTKVRVNGLNTYGGDPTTVGTVYPGTAVNAVLGLEYTITQHWALALDIANHATDKTQFIGTTVQPVGNNQWTYQLSFAPAIEYNSNNKVGIIAGVWFAPVGFGAADFVNGVFAVNWYI